MADLEMMERFGADANGLKPSPDFPYVVKCERCGRDMARSQKPSPPRPCAWPGANSYGGMCETATAVESDDCA
jgi:hypothetical protein